MSKQRPLSDFELAIRKEYGNAILKLRSTLGWSRKQLAACTSRSHSSIKDYEMNLASMRPNIMSQLARAFRFPVERLFPSIADAVQLKAYVRDINVMNDEMQARVQSAGGWIEPPTIVKKTNDTSVSSANSSEPSSTYTWDVEETEENVFKMLAKLIDKLGSCSIKFFDSGSITREEAKEYHRFVEIYSEIEILCNKGAISKEAADMTKKSLIENYTRGDVSFDSESSTDN